MLLDASHIIIRERYILFGASLVILLLLILAWVLWRSNQKQRLFQKLLQMRTQELARQGVELQFSNERLESQQKILQRQRDQLDLAFRELQELNQFKQSLMGMIVHDLKNPINTILMLSQTPIDESNRQMIHAAGRQMLNLVLNILDIQKFEETVVKPKREEVDLLPWVREVVGQVALAAAHRGIRLMIDVPEGVRAWFDPEMMARVLVNLLTNAIKYSPPEGEVNIAFSGMPDRRLVATVRDQGPGIAPEHRDLIFRKFGQALPRELGNIRSTGLGLAYCRLVIEAHGGAIQVDELPPASGSCFRIELPEAALPNEVPDRTRLSSVNINLVDELPALTEADRQALAPVVRRLERLKFYDAGLIVNVLDLLNGGASESVEQWRRQLEQALFAGNETRYHRLIEQAAKG